MPMDAMATALLPDLVCLRDTQIWLVLARTVRKPALPAPSLSSAKGHAPGVSCPPS